jgi:hypothetical protein
MFFTAALLVTFITLTASLLRSFHNVRYLASCTLEDSHCMQDVSGWLYRNVVKCVLPPFKCMAAMHVSLRWWPKFSAE